jgi:hypothetical protein
MTPPAAIAPPLGRRHLQQSRAARRFLMSEESFERNCLARTGLEVFFQFSRFSLCLNCNIGSQLDGAISFGGLHLSFLVRREAALMECWKRNISGCLVEHSREPSPPKAVLPISPALRLTKRPVFLPWFTLRAMVGVLLQPGPAAGRWRGFILLRSFPRAMRRVFPSP